MEEDGDTEPEVNFLYLTHYLDVLRQLRSHLSGHDDIPLPPTFIPPTGYWTSQEKDCFFHGLSVYSRLRPDLIADCIKTKSVVDVCNYLEILEKAASGYEQNEGQVHRTEIPGAMEVSQDWVEFEEDRATEILAAEGHWDQEALHKKRAQDIQAQKTLLKDERKNSRDRGSDEASTHLDARDLAFKPWLAEQRERWKKEDFCKALDSRDLVAVGMILREAEQTSVDVLEPPDTTVIPRTQQTCAPSDVPIPPLTEQSQPQAQNPIHDSVIDPVLLALSGKPQQAEQPTPTNILEESRSVAAPSPSPEPSTVPANLSPTSRRRYQKRLYMRRKRAKLLGGDVDETAYRLKPGRKAKKVARSRSATADNIVDASTDKMEVDVDVEQIDDEGEGGEVHHSHVSGKTLPYKILARFRATGLDVEALRELNLDLFHPGVLAKLMNLYASLSEEGSAPEPRISFETVRLLRMHIVRFVTELMHRAIVLREQEQTLKRHTKVWKVSNKKVITKDNIEQALELMGFRNLSKQDYLSRLIGRFDFEEDDDDGGNCSAPEKPERTLSEPPIPGEDKSRLEPHRAIYTPFICLPPTINDDSLVPEEIDDDELHTELLEEEELDKMDCMLDDMHEKGLWERYRDAKERANKMGRHDDVDNRGDDLFDHEEPSPGRIKSKAFISDSD